ncbi:uncharacterized protein LAESUDRAFT_811512 [Laetiporus sulphureus 93-53]|uniref:F-box domain-containing protein n=1 Tax=Laetiporus sulphureus 93-53 TaxID=1314785 RepID=A0A165F5K1_9APHY|nr:uncharacterized protein LAESUDRAFT_811512 [Laetiporus sulphureus 93-53]KZT08432.1 hypothetical protein LAESUDRAFT_811512 [Laetiporus sulphureus 93-53]
MSRLAQNHPQQMPRSSLGLEQPHHDTRILLNASTAGHSPKTQTSTFARAFPQELVDYIIDFSHSDVEMLRSCACVCRSWREESQYHLFSTVTIESVETLKRFAHLVESEPHISSKVRELCFEAYKSFRRGVPPAWICWITNLPVTNLTRLKSLRFENVEWHRIHMSRLFFFPGLQKYSRIRELHLSGCTFAGFEDYEDLVFCFPKLTTIALDVISWQSNPIGTLKSFSPKRSSLQLSSLSLKRHCTPMILIEWILKTSSVSSLKSVEFYWVLPDELKSVGQFLQRLNRSLEHLRIGCRFDRKSSMAQTIGDYLDLSKDTNLKSLHLAILDLSEHSLPWVSTLLAQVIEVPLSRLSFDITMNIPSQVAGPQWDHIAWILSRTACKSLREVIFVHRGILDFRHAEAALQRQLPDLVRRRILQIHDRSFRDELAY